MDWNSVLGCACGEPGILDRNSDGIRYVRAVGCKRQDSWSYIRLGTNREYFYAWKNITDHNTGS